MGLGPGARDNRITMIDLPDRSAVLEEVLSLTVRSAPRLEVVERTLTDGYACALQLESERLGFQRLLQEQAAALAEGPTASRVAEVADFARGIARAETELAELRAALVRLAEIARRLR